MLARRVEQLPTWLLEVWRAAKAYPTTLALPALARVGLTRMRIVIDLPAPLGPGNQ